MGTPRYLLVRHSREESPIRVSIEMVDKFDCSNYKFLKESELNGVPVQEWVWEKDFPLYKKFI